MQNDKTTPDVQEGSEDTLDPKPEVQKTPNEEINEFLRTWGWKDWALFTVPLVFLVYSLAIIRPLMPKLLVENPSLLVTLSGSRSGLIVLGSRFSLHHEPWIIPLLIGLIPGIIMLMVYYVMGSRWGEKAVSLIFSVRPKWFMKLEDFIRRHPGISLFACFIPFSPLPTPIVLVLAGIEKVRWYVIAGYVLVYSILVKVFYFYLGTRFGAEVEEIVKVIDKYMLYITLGILAYVFFIAWYRQKKMAKKLAGVKNPEEASDNTSEEVDGSIGDGLIETDRAEDAGNVTPGKE